MSASPAPHLATLVVGDAVTKLEALTVVALAVDGTVDDAGTSRPVIRLSPTAWAQIDIPKFGEPPPLAIDVYSTLDASDARRQALALASALAENTDWSIVPKFDGGDAL